MELNGFPKKLTERTIKNSLKEKVNKEASNDDENWINLYLPYEKGISEKIAKFSKKYNVKVVHTKSKSLKNVLKQKQIENKNEHNITQGTVYKVSCNDCDKFYIGETGRKLNIRLNEHKRDAKNKTGNMSGLSQHITKYKHTADWENYT